MPSHDSKPLRDFYEKGQNFLAESRNEPDPDLRQLEREMAVRYFEADIKQGFTKGSDRDNIEDMMAEQRDSGSASGAHQTPKQTDATSAFYRFLEQALTLGTRGIRKSALPTYIGWLVYVGLIALLATGIFLSRPQVIAAAIALLLIAALVAILLLGGVFNKLHPIVANVIALLIVVGFLAVTAYTVVKLVNSPDSEKRPAQQSQPSTAPPGPATPGTGSNTEAGTRLARSNPLLPNGGGNDALLQRYAGDEVTLAQLGEQAFAKQDYQWTVKYLEQARAVQSSKVWERDYPYLATAYLLTNGDEQRFESTLQDMLAEMRLNNSFLHHSTAIGIALSNLSDARNYVAGPAQQYMDQVRDQAIRIKAQLSP